VHGESKFVAVTAEALSSLMPLGLRRPSTVTIEQRDVDPTVKITFLEHDPVGFEKQIGIEYKPGSIGKGRSPIALWPARSASGVRRARMGRHVWLARALGIAR